MIENWKEAMTDFGFCVKKIPSLEKSIDVLVFECPEQFKSVQLNMEVESAQDVQGKSLVCALYAIDSKGDVVEFNASSWPRSPKLSAPYQYLPGVERIARFNLRTFESEYGLSMLFVALFPWGKSVSHEGTKFGRCFAGIQMSLDSQRFTAFHRLHRVEQSND